MNIFYLRNVLVFFMLLSAVQVMDAMPRRGKGYSIYVFDNDEGASSSQGSSPSSATSNRRDRAIALLDASKKLLVKKIKKFVTDHPEIQNEDFLNRFERGVRVSEAEEKEDKSLIIECKIFLRDFLSSGETASWLSISGYGDMLENNDEMLSKFDRIYQLSLVHGEEFDKAMLGKMLAEHETNKKKTGQRVKRAVIVGGGPSGLYTAIKLFQAGIKVTLVNNLKKYNRKYIVGLAEDWMFQLEILLGTKFDKYFGKDSLHGKVVDNGTGEINLNYLEEALKETLKALAEKSKGAIQIIFGVGVEKIEFPASPNTNYEAVLSNGAKIPFDILICAGGVDDKIRNTYLGMPKQLTAVHNYGIAVFVKDEKFENEKLLGETTNAYVLSRKLKDQKLDDEIEKSQLLSKEVKTEYKEGSATMAKRMTGFYAFENRASIHITALTDPGLVKVFKEIERQKQELGTNAETLRKKLNKLKEKIERKWLAALGHWVVNVEKQRVEINTGLDMKAGMLNFDPYPGNSSTFDLVISSLDQPAVEYNLFGKSAIVLAVGDSAASQHMFTGTGMTNLKISVEATVKHIDDYNHGIIRKAEGLLHKLRGELEKLRDEMNEQSKEKTFTERLPQSIIKNNTQEQMDEIAFKAMCSEVNRIIEEGNSQADHKLFVTTSKTVSQEKPDFEIVVKGKTYPATVTNKGQIQIGKKGTNAFNTLVQAAIWLREVKK